MESRAHTLYPIALTEWCSDFGKGSRYEVKNITGWRKDLYSRRPFTSAFLWVVGKGSPSKGSGAKRNGGSR